MLLVSDPDTTASTLVRVLAGLARRRSGRVRIAGSTDPTAAGWGRRLAYVGPNPGLHTWMTPIEVLTLAGRLLDLPSDELARRTQRALAWTRIPASEASRPIARGGPPLRQRAAFAAALVGDPEVLLLDEPLRALDAEERASVLRLPGARRTVVMASRHPASEAGLMKQVAYLRNGRVHLAAPISALEREGLPLSHRGIAALAERKDAGVRAGASVEA